MNVHYGHLDTYPRDPELTVLAVCPCGWRSGPYVGKAAGQRAVVQHNRDVHHVHPSQAQRNLLRSSA